MTPNDLRRQEGTDDVPATLAALDAADYQLLGVDSDGDAHYYSDLTGRVLALSDPRDITTEVGRIHVGDDAQLEQWLVHVERRTGWDWLATSRGPVRRLAVSALALASDSR